MLWVTFVQVFPPHTAPPVKLVPVLQGSADGKTGWKDYEWTDFVCNPDRPPPFVAPRQPRVDYKLFYEAAGKEPLRFDSQSH